MGGKKFIRMITVVFVLSLLASACDSPEKEGRPPEANSSEPPHTSVVPSNSALPLSPSSSPDLPAGSEEKGDTGRPGTFELSACPRSLTARESGSRKIYRLMQTFSLQQPL